MLVKILIIIVLVAIIISLGSGLFFLVKDKSDSKRTVKALTVRIVLSVSLFALLVLGYLTGVIKPHGIYGTPPASPSAPPMDK